MSSDEKGEYEPILEGTNSIPDDLSYLEKTRFSWLSPRKNYTVFLIVHLAFLSLNVSLLALNIFHFRQHNNVLNHHYSDSEIQEPWCEC
jgi:hypothetical protein